MMDKLEMLTAREQLMEDIDVIISSRIDGQKIGARATRKRSE